MTADVRARALMERRGELLQRLPRVLATARSLPESDRELVVDEAIAYTALEHTDPVATPEDLERLFWTACQLRVGNALRGRSSTVRAGWQRVSTDALEVLTDASDPAGDVERSHERAVLEEFVATLDERERQVLRCKYDPSERDPLGCELIARRLGITVAAARAAERSIQRSIKHFAAIYTAGRLCPNREPQITALAAGKAYGARALLARTHIAHCQHCRHTYAGQLRAFRSAAFGRETAALLPIPAEPHSRGRIRATWDAIADTLTRPFAHDSTTAVAHFAASGAGRGAGTIAALKIAGACMASATAVGVCATTFVAPVLNNNHSPRAAAAAPSKTPRPPARTTQTSTGPRERLPHGAPSPTATPEPRAKPKRAKRRAIQRKPRSTAPAATQGGTGPTDHENTPVSPAPANAAPGGASEFDPSYQPSAPQPAPVPAAPGAIEFP